MTIETRWKSNMTRTIVRHIIMFRYV